MTSVTQSENGEGEGVRVAVARADTDSLYSWAARDEHGRGSCGLTSEPARAETHLTEALCSLPAGATGFIQRVWLDRDARQPTYIHGSVLLRLRRYERAIVEAS